jgi:hypothetical protein
MPRFFRYFRIAFSATCLIAAVLLVVLWVRSYWWESTLQGTIGSERMQLTSEPGQISILVFPNVQSKNFPKRSWTLERHDIMRPDFIAWTFRKMKPKGILVCVPYWFPALITAAIASFAALPWSWRFSLRTLLIAMTLIAVGLGIIVWMTRAG